MSLKWKKKTHVNDLTIKFLFFYLLHLNLSFLKTYQFENPLALTLKPRYPSENGIFANLTNYVHDCRLIVLQTTNSLNTEQLFGSIYMFMSCAYYWLSHFPLLYFIMLRLHNVYNLYLEVYCLYMFMCCAFLGLRHSPLLHCT